MSKEPPSFVRTFMTHDMPDEDILALATGRGEEFAQITNAVERSRRASPGTLQHVVLYGSRGFGKSFMTRRVQIEAAGLGGDRGPVHFILLPEEQHNLQRNPQALLDYLAHKLDDVTRDSDEGFEAAMFQWPAPGDEGKRWEVAAKRLEASIDAALPGGKGLVIAAVENFDALLKSLFDKETDEQRLRQWLDRPRNRLMLFATATGTVDIDYDRPLFQAFESVQLAPWNPDDCVAYFNRLRDRDGRDRLTPEQEAKARAIAEFIGGTPRLAQLLAEVIDTQEALTVAETMSALADRLAEYYRKRIEDLPPLAQGLLDALIRGGESVSQTKLAKRVGAGGQNAIARVMTDLQRADIIRGRRAPKGRETLYSVTDRVFVHYYRLRQGSRAARTTPLSTILDFLKSFYSRDEQRQQALKHLEAGRPAEAGLFSRLAMEGEKWEPDDFTNDFSRRFQVYLNAVPERARDEASAFLERLIQEPEQGYYLRNHVDCSDPALAALDAAARAQALHRLGHSDAARQELERAMAAAGEEAVPVTIAGIELLRCDLEVADDFAASVEVARRMRNFTGLVPNPDLELEGTMTAFAALQDEDLEAGWRALKLAREQGQQLVEGRLLSLLATSLYRIDRYEEALDASAQAQTIAEILDEGGLRAQSLSLQASILHQLRRFEEAVTAGNLAIEWFEARDLMNEQAAILSSIAWSMFSLDRFEEANVLALKAITLASGLGDRRRELAARAVSLSAYSRLENGEEAVDQARHTVRLAAELGDDRGEGAALNMLANELARLGRFDDALEASERGLKVAERGGAANEMAMHWTQMAFALNALDRDDEAREAIEAASNLASEADRGEYTRVMRLIAVSIATRQAIREPVARFRRALEDQLQRPNEPYPNAFHWISDLFLAAARSGEFVELDALLDANADWFAAPPAPLLFRTSDGEALARIAETEGRAACYEAFAGLLPRIAALMAKLPEDKRDATWLPDLLSGFAGVCRDPGLLRDVAGLLTEDLAPQGPESAALLRTIAEVDEADNAEAVLAETDPDAATLIRRLRDLPEPAIPAPKPSRGGKRSK